jgi:hypothetical protein
MKVSHGRLAGSSRNDEAAARIAEGHAVAAERDARASGIIQKLERPLRHDYEYTIRRVDCRHPHRPTCFSLGEKQSMVNCNENSFEWTFELHEDRFWNNFHADWYLPIIKDWKNSITSQLYVDWAYMQQKHNPVFNKVIAKAQSHGNFDIVGMYQDWNTELVAQFYSTAWRSGNRYDSTINFNIEGHQFNICVREFPTIFGLADNDFLRAEISTKRTMAENELAPLYFSINENYYGKTHGLLPG